MRSSRFYPLTCISQYCGRAECTGCENKPYLDAFEEWKRRTKALRPDPIWSPRYWVATVEEEGDA